MPLKFLTAVMFLTLIAYPVAALTVPFALISTDDGFVISAGVSDGTDVKALLIKIDSEGNPVWNRTFVADCKASIWSVAKLDDGYAVGGVAGCGEDGWVAKVDEDGNMVWQKTYGYRLTQEGVPTVVPDGREIIAAITVTACDDCENRDTWIIKFDGQGNELWKKELSFKEYDSIKMMKKTGDGGYIAVGAVSESIASLNYDVWIMKFDADMNEEWVKFLDLGFQDVAWDVAESDAGYTIAGVSWSDCVPCSMRSEGYARAFALQLNKSGSLTGKKFFDELGHVSSAWSVAGGEEVMIAGLAINETEKYIWLSTLNNTFAKISVNFKLLPVFGIVRMVKLEDGYLMVTSGCDGECIWTGRIGSDGRLLWEREYSFGAGKCSPEEPENEFSSGLDEENNTKVSNYEGEIIEISETGGDGNRSDSLFTGVVLILIAVVMVYAISRF
uniref:Uncharacterized protein n=1 Tax=Archaeoglobus fulgidus TaxID=2234 RepID=A0A7C3MAY9_ARCFL